MSAVSPAERTLFFVAAAFNALVALALVLPGDFAWNLLGLLRPEKMLFVHLFAVMVAAFGLAYFWIARNPGGKRVLIELAIIGKLAVFGVALAHGLAGTAPMSLALLASGDLVFAALFFDFLRRHPQLG